MVFFVISTALERLFEINSRDLKIAYKQSHLNLDVQGAQRQNVKLTQIFSATNASAIEYASRRFVDNWRIEEFMDNCPEWLQLLHS